MTTQLICLLIGMVLPYIWAGASVPFRSRQFGKVELNQPRVQADQLKDGGARVVGAQANAWEALTLFAAANVGALMGGVDPSGSWALATMIWAAARVGHGVFYLMDIAALRVLSFAIGTGMSIWILVMGLMQQ
tara:strand:- start:5018 stop:5416 length:399 start_codon:yes stop_codon:yes gene_type:complete